MSTTVKQLAKISGVSVRTLHYYDEIGLLKPARVGENGYRYYEEEQLLRLQQIMFYRELGIPLGEIKPLLEAGDADRIEALRSHQRVLEKRERETRELIRTITKTIAKLKGEADMKNEEMFLGFDQAKQEEREKYLVDRYGDHAREHIEESKRRMKSWGKEDYARVRREASEVLQKLAVRLDAGASPSDSAVQELIRLHYRWVCNFWTPDRQAYIGLGSLYVDHPEFRKFHEAYHPGLSVFLAEAMKEFAERELA